MIGRFALLARAALVALALLLSPAPAASADYQYVAGQETLGPNDGVCPGIGIVANAGYYRNEAGRDPRANEPFYLEIKLQYFESFDCAAAFTGINVTLPAGLNLDTTDPRRVACQRFNLATGAADPRANANCPAQPPNIGPATFALDPIATNYPEASSFGRRYWFQGYDQATNATYRVLRLLVPVSAPAAVNAPVTFTMKRFDAINPWTASVNVATTGAAQPGNGGTFVAPRLSVQNGAGEFQVSPIGIQVPFSVSKGSTPYGISEKVVLGTNPLDPAYQPVGNPGCGQGQTGIADFNADESFLDVFGDFGDPFAVSPPCDLLPSTQFTLDICMAYDPPDTPPTGQCEATTFTTPPVNVQVAIAESATDARVATFTSALSGAWPPGAVTTELKKPGGAFGSVGTNAGLARGTGNVTVNQIQRGDLVPWQEHAVRGCFNPDSAGPPTVCVNEQTFFAGAIEAPGDASVVDTTATVAPVKLRAPNPAMTLQLRARKASEVTSQDPSTLPVVASVPVPAASNPGTTAVADLVATALEATTRYAWTVCAELDGDAAPEKCSPGDAFTTGAAPAATPSPTPSASPAPAPTAQPTATPSADRTKPTAKLRVKGKLKRRKRVTLTVTASDASGISRVTIKVGRKKAVAKRRLVIRLPSKKGKLRIVVTVIDRAGNRTVIRRTLTVK